MNGYIHSVETAGMVDGPGIRYVVFFAGCNLRCKYCHNPDTWRMKDGHHSTVDELLRDIKKYKSYLQFSGGGVTIGGGEPFVQADFLVELLTACKTACFHTALDTSGYTKPEKARAALEQTDLLLLDIKSINPRAYKDLTKVDLAPTLETLGIARELDVRTWVRYVLVPGLTDKEDDLRALAAYLQDYPNIERIEVLPFHKLGEFKWKELGLHYELTDTQPPTAAELAKAKQILQKEPS